MSNEPVKVAIVTGANRGLGRAIARRLAARPMRLVLTARDEALLAEAAEDIRAAGGEAEVIVGDLTDPALPAEIVSTAMDRFGRIDVLVNNAGATKRGRFTELTEADWQDGFALKFFGAVRLTRLAWPHLVSARGAVVMISGIGGRTPGAEFAIGGAVNAALLSLTKALAEQGIADGVRVNAINPGRIATDRLAKRLQTFATAHGLEPAEAASQMLAEAGIARFGEPEEIAALVEFLVSPEGNFFQGALLDIDGGETKTI